MKLNFSISLWNYIHYFPLRKGGTSFAFSDGLDGLERIVAEIGAQGYGVELWPWWASWEWTSPQREGMVAQQIDLYAVEQRDRLRDLLKDVRSSWHTDGDNTIEGYRRKIDTLAHVGSRVLVVHASNLFLDGPEPDFDFAARVLDLARARGVKIALENASEGEQEEDPTLWNFSILRRAIARFEEVGVGRLHTVPGTGKISAEDWLYLLEALKEIGFQGDSVLEIKPLDPLRIAAQTEAFFDGLTL